MEGVEFRAFMVGENLAVDSVDGWDKDPYLYKLNKEYWMGAALDFAKINDIATCPKCRNDVNAQPIDIG